MELCARCKKRIAVVYITKIESNKTVNEGICLKCAKQLGIKPVDSFIQKLGLSDEDLDSMDMEMEGLIESSEENPDSQADPPAENTENEEGRAPAVDFRRLFGSAMISGIPPQQQKNGQQRQGNKPGTKKKYLDLYCSNLTQRALDNKLDKIVGRERELQRMIQILCRRQKNNPCLIGEPGVGKTAIAEALAQKIADGRVPYRLRDKEVHVVDLTALVAGTQFRGQFESRMKGLIDEVKSLGNIIMVIDEVHSIVGAGDAEGSMNAANILKPALSKGDVQIIGATTLTEYRKYIEKDSALERRFQPIIIEEPSIEDTLTILCGIKNYYESFHGIKIPDETLKHAVVLSERYITDRFLPDKAIDLLDEASAYLALNSSCINRLESLKVSLEATKAEKAALETTEETDDSKLSEKYRRLADLKVREINDMKLFNELSAERDKIALSHADLAQVIEIWTGIPASNITEHEFARIDQLDTRLKQRIVGQDAAIESVVRAIKRNRAGVSYKRKPVSFIFAGTTGVGKTELVKTLAADMFNSPESLIRLDMSEFMEKHSVSRIIGSPPGYVGYDEAGQLTEKIRRKPYSVILFDEIEKAHPDVLNVLLQILDDGHITDAHGKQVNFENTIIVMTTNAGSNLNMNTAGFGSSTHTQTEDRTQKALSDFLRPEFLNRVDEIITFRSLDEKDFAAIAHIMLNDLVNVMREKDITVSYSDEASNFIARKSFSGKYGARNMRRYIQTEVEDVIANHIISNYRKKTKSINIGISDDGEALTFLYESDADMPVPVKNDDDREMV